MKTNVITHRLDGIIIQPNTNDGNVRIILRQNSVNTNAAPVIETNSWNFPHEVTEIINRRVADGGFGITEGPIYSQEITDENGTLEIYKAALDLMGENIVWSCENIENIEGYLYGDLKWFSEISKGVIFSELNLKSHYIQIPYVNYDLPDYAQAAIATVTAFVVINKIHDVSKEIQKLAAELASVIGSVSALLKIILATLWVIIVITLIISLILDIFRHLVQPVKYHSAMKLKKLLEIGCEQIGLKFESSVFENLTMENLAILPAKSETLSQGGDLFSLGFTAPNYDDSSGEYAGSLYELIDAFNTAFHAEASIVDGVLKLEPIATAVQDPVYELPDLENYPTDPHRTNLKADYNSSYKLTFTEDTSDSQTINHNTGTRALAITRPIDVKDELAVIGGKKVNVNIPFARGFRKLELSHVEKILDNFIKDYGPVLNGVITVANVLINTINNVISKVEKLIKALKFIGIDIPFDPETISTIEGVSLSLIEDRIGMLLAKDFFTKDKLISVDVGSTPFLTKVRPENEKTIAADYFYNTYHYVQSLEVTDENPTGSQYHIYKHPAFHLCKEGAQEIFNNKRIFTHGKRAIAEVVSCGWYAETGTAEIEIKIPTLITDNFKTILIT